MPYNTRRKSLSLPSLGIHVPMTHASRTAHRATLSHGGTSSSTASSSTTCSQTRGACSSPSSAHPSAHRHTSSTPSAASPALDHPSPASADSMAQRLHPNKKVKRSHGASDSVSFSTPLSLSSTPSASTAAATSATKKNAAIADTPPPSPKRMRMRHPSVEMDDAESYADASSVETDIDMDAVNDDIVEAVILQLMATGNRPHLIKELSAILMQHLRSVQQSANPCAIISSRLASYMKRPCWSPSTPCPLAKELETIHPRRTYYFLTTRPHLPLPDASSPAFIVPRTSIITPPLSSAASGSESAEEERRRELSPSPEVDLSSPEFDDADDDFLMPSTPIGASSLRLSRLSHVNYISRNQRGASPPLEKDEKEFTQTAEGLQKRKLAGHLLQQSPSAASAVYPVSPSLQSPSSLSLSLSLGHGADFDDAGRDEAMLFGAESRLSVNSANSAIFSMATSPAMRPLLAKKEIEADGWAKLDSVLDWDRSPENIELEELDGLLVDF